MSVNRKWVGQVRAVLDDLADHTARQEPQNGRESEAWRGFSQQQQYTAGPLEQTPRARAAREINRIAARYGWGAEVERYLDQVGATGLAALSDNQLAQLRDRMRSLVDVAMHAFDLDDDLPPR